VAVTMVQIGIVLMCMDQRFVRMFMSMRFLSIPDLARSGKCWVSILSGEQGIQQNFDASVVPLCKKRKIVVVDGALYGLS